MSAEVLRFPERNQGRKRRCRSLNAAGLLSMQLMVRDGEAIPQNVDRIDFPKDAAGVPSRSVELLFALAIWCALSPEQREGVKKSVRLSVYDGQRADECAIQLHNLLNGGR